MMPKKVLVALPPGLLEQIDFVAQVEHRTRSDLIREALRRYIQAFERTQKPTQLRAVAHQPPSGISVDAHEEVAAGIMEGRPPVSPVKSERGGSDWLDRPLG